MTQAEAQKLAAKLFAAFPYHPEEMTVAVYLEQMVKLPNPEWALEAVNAIIRTEERLPAVATVLRTYKAIKDSHPAPALDEPNLTPEQIAFNKAQLAALMERLSAKQTGWVAE